MKIKIIALSTCLCICLTCLIIGLVNPPQQPDITHTPSATEPDNTRPTVDTKELLLPQGMYYCIGTTIGQHSPSDESIEYWFTNIVPNIQITPNNKYVFSYHGSSVSGSAHSYGDAIIFDDDGKQLRDFYTFCTDHDEEWLNQYGTPNNSWYAEYDNVNQIITFYEKNDYTQFKYFATIADAIAYIQQTYPIHNDMYIIYPPQPTCE